jgi:hypothetical protein
LKKIILLLIIISTLSSCEKKSPKVSFYFWRTNFKLSTLEKKTIQSNDVKKIYLRYFDVALAHNNPFPVATIYITEHLKNVAIVPVVFIKNTVFLSEQTNAKDLAQKVLKLINQINQKHKINCNEIQIDCDWSLESREKYFEFLSYFRKESKRKVSATIRLHQVKYFEKTKIPPVDGGVLMLYNMGKIGANEENSIYDAQVAQQYITSLKNYPLKVNVALPIFSWAIHIRNNQVVNLISKVNIGNFTSDKNFDNYKDNFFKVKENQIKLGLFFKKGDIIKVESISKGNIKEMINQLSDNCVLPPDEIIYYDLDENNIKQYPDESFFKKCNSWF